MSETKLFLKVTTFLVVILAMCLVGCSDSTNPKPPNGGNGIGDDNTEWPPLEWRARVGLNGLNKPAGVFNIWYWGYDEDGHQTWTASEVNSLDIAFEGNVNSKNAILLFFSGREQEDDPDYDGWIVEGPDSESYPGETLYWFHRHLAVNYGYAFTFTCRENDTAFKLEGGIGQLLY